MILLKEILPWVLSGLTIWMTFEVGNKDKNAWLLGLVGQFGWFLFTFLYESWGLLPLNIVLTILYIKNHIKWNNND